MIQIDGSWYYSPDTDIDGNARSMPVGTKPDMGAYENQTITPIAGLVAYYPFNGNANDESGKGNDGTVNGAILTADRFGKANSAYSFDGVDDYIETSEFQMTTNSFSVSYWVYDDEYDAGFHGGHLYCYVTSSSYDRFWFIDYSDGSGIGYKVGDSDADEIVLYQPTVPSPGWHHVLGTFDNDQHESRLFIDGELSISGINASLVITSMTRKLVVGTADTGYGYWFRGKIDDIRIFNLALSEAEIQALYHEGSGDAGNTISHWTFDEMAGDTLYDVSSNGHHGVITKASWAEGYSGGALQFGDSAYVTVPYAVDTRPVEAITLEAIVLFETFDPMQAIVSTSEYGGYGLWIYNSIPDIYIQIDSVYYSAAYSGGLVTDRWYHIAGVFDGSAVKYYINRALKDSVPASGNITYQYENALQIGAEAGKEDLPELRTSFHGRIDAIRISGRALSPGEFLAFDAISVAVSPVQSDVPEGFSLHPAYPNPFNPVSTIRYDLPQKSEVALTVYDILGREVVRLVEGYIEPGYHQVKWDGRDKGGREVPSGIYIARLAAQEYSTSIKMLLMR
ncbi:MAG: T9SS type A sorting domain-containing protein [Fidelibacterota bacterium]|nr:MAG: T9SS type A sorting domain-containing protein [Candidatus Neomarinimicrobiota bacterium]